MIDFKKLKAKIFEKFGTAKNFAEKLGKNDTYVSRLMTGKKNFSRQEVIEWSKALELSSDEMLEIFFDYAVAN